MERFFIDQGNRTVRIKASQRKRYKMPDGTFDVILKEKWDQVLGISF